MAGSIFNELSGLLLTTQALLDCPEPKYEAWDEYNDRRDELFSRLKEHSWRMPESAEEAGALQTLMASILEKDQLLVQKIQREMSSIRQEMEAVAEQRRLVKTYRAGPGASRALHRFTA